MQTLSKEQVYEYYQKGMIAILPMPIGEMAYSVHYLSRQDWDRNYLEFFIEREPFSVKMMANWHRMGFQYEIGWFESEEAAITAIYENHKADRYLGIEITKKYKSERK